MRFGALLLATGTLLAVARLAADGWTAWASLSRARASLDSAQQVARLDDPAALATALNRLSAEASAAHRATSGPLWSMGVRLPVLGHSFRVARGISAAVDVLAQQAAPPLVSAVRQVRPADLLRRDGSLDLARMSALRAPLSSALQGLQRARATVLALPMSELPAPLAAARNTLLTDLDRATTRVADLRSAAQLAPAMLGGSSPRRYFVAFQNPAEARGTGGLLGIYGILEARQGKLHLVTVGSDATLRPADRPVVPLSAAYLNQYGQYDPARFWSSSNLSPDFPVAARIWTGLWQAQSGVRLDGAISVDPVVMSYLLGVTGPVTLPDGTQVTEGNVVTLTTSGVYARFPDNDRRKAFLADLTGAVFEAVTARAPARPSALLAALGRAVGEGRLHVASTYSDSEEAQLQSMPLGGSLSTTAAPFALVRVLNAGGNKLDYYLKRTIRYTGGTCVAGRRRTQVVVRLANTVSGPLPAYVSGVVNAAAGVPTDGTNRMDLSLFATRGARLLSARVNGVTEAVTVNSEQGHPVYGLRLDVRPASTSTVTFDLDEPATAGTPVVPVQPLIRAADVHVAFAACPGQS